MKQIYKGKLKLRIKKECPYYGTAYRDLEKVIFYKWGWSLSLWTVHKDSVIGEYSDWAKERILSVYPDAEIEGHSVRVKGDYISVPEFIFNEGYDFGPTEDSCVLYEKKNEKYIGYSHRGSCSFGVGDMLFSEDIKSYSAYYKMPKYRWKYIMTLLKYHIKGDSIMFEDICEDNIIGHGISQVIPFRERGTKKIETLEEAYQAAVNFAKYVS